MKLWRFQTKNKLPDFGYRWYFWQASPSYRLKGKFISELLEPYFCCEIFTLGGRDRLWKGLLGDVPLSYRNYLTEVRVSVPSPLLPSRPSPPR